MRLLLTTDMADTCGVSLAIGKHFRLNQKATLTRAIKTGTATRGPMTAAKASPELMPKMAMASSKPLEAAAILVDERKSLSAPSSVPPSGRRRGARREEQRHNAQPDFFEKCLENLYCILHVFSYIRISGYMRENVTIQLGAKNLQNHCTVTEQECLRFVHLRR